MLRLSPVLVLAVLIIPACGGGRGDDRAATDSSPSVSPDVEGLLRSAGSAADPFAFKVRSVEHVQHTWGPQVNIELETTLAVAKQATEADLHTLWDRLLPALGDRRVFLRVTTDVPGATPWGLVTRILVDQLRDRCTV